MCLVDLVLSFDLLVLCLLDELSNTTISGDGEQCFVLCLFVSFVVDLSLLLVLSLLEKSMLLLL